MVQLVPWSSTDSWVLGISSLGQSLWPVEGDLSPNLLVLLLEGLARLNCFCSLQGLGLGIQIYGFDTLSLSLRSNSPFEGGFVGNQIVERLRVLRRLRQGGFSRAAPRNQSRRGFLKPLILLSFLFFEMEETVLIDEYSRELGEFDPQMEEEDERPIDPTSDIDITSFSDVMFSSSDFM
ncbi:hypothetical protein F2Q70_00028589 [Brassica cretica]|uniref:Uncharacterized protein n=1 Tax=Brassica cretica TaxID=69181 RepID=A0A8S9L9R9_BRACR|nr:hypothetical protein F2Q70_00028589 [Brassica cretica]